MTDNVVLFPGRSIELMPETPPNDVLEAAKNAGLKYVVVLGYTPGDDVYIATSNDSVPEALLLVETFKHDLFEPQS